MLGKVQYLHFAQHRAINQDKPQLERRVKKRSSAIEGKANYIVLWL